MTIRLAPQRRFDIGQAEEAADQQEERDERKHREEQDRR